MSLRSFHLLFIAASLALMAFVTVWSGRQYLSGNDHLGSAAAAAALFLGGLAYLPWFIRRTKRLG